MSGDRDGNDGEIAIERRLGHPPEKVWRALTERELLQAWMMANDFEPRVGHRFRLTAAPQPPWDGTLEGEVLRVRPPWQLAYTCNTVGPDEGARLRTIVTWTLTPHEGGTTLRMRQTGFRADQVAQYERSVRAWRQELDGLERLCGTLQ